MSLYDVQHFSAYVEALPGGTLVEQWDSHVAKIGGKVFGLLGVDREAICFKVEELSFDGLCALEGVTQAPYFATRRWVVVHRGSDLSEDELKAYLDRSYQLVVAKLTKKIRREIGVPDASAN